MGDDASRRDKLRETARGRFEMGRAAWPHLTLDAEAFERYFARHAASDPGPLEAHAADMYLACACALGVSGALEAFERTFSADLRRAVATVDSSQAFVEEVLQATRERLLVRTSADPSKIADYAGRASLQSWLRAVVVRWAISQRRRKSDQRHETFSVEADRRLAKGGPEFDFLRGRYKDAFEGAVRSAIERLPAKERLLLRLNLVDGLSVDKLALVYKVGRSTAARWLASARSALLEEARSEMRATLGLTASELQSLGHDMRSQLEVSILRLLGRDDEDGTIS